MAGEKRLRKSERDRKFIRDVIPLDTPLGINIEPTSACNFRCRFCFQGNIDIEKEDGFKRGFMDFDLYKKIIDDLKKFDKPLKSLYLYLRGEPLLHPQIADMVRYAKEAKVAEEICIFTNGVFLTEETAEKLIDAGLDVLNISIEGLSDADYMDITGVDVKFDEIVKNVEYFYKHKKQCELYVKIPYIFYTVDQMKEFERIFSDICDFYFEEHLDDAYQGLAKEGLSEEEYELIDRRYRGMAKYRRKVCPCIFIRYNVLYDGTVTPCLEDFKKDMPIGDVKTESMVDIWNGEKMKQLRYAQLTGNLENYPMCQRDCTAYKDIHHVGNDMDNIDNLPEEVIEKFKPSV